MPNMFEFDIEEQAALTQGMFAHPNIKTYILTIHWTPEFRQANHFCEQLVNFPGNLAEGFKCRIKTTFTQNEVVEIFNSLRDAKVVPGQAYEPYAANGLRVNKNNICFYKPDTDLEAVNTEIQLSANFNGGIDFSSKEELIWPRSELSSYMNDVESNDEFLNKLHSAALITGACPICYANQVYSLI